MPVTIPLSTVVDRLRALADVLENPTPATPATQADLRAILDVADRMLLKYGRLAPLGAAVREASASLPQLLEAAKIVEEELKDSPLLSLLSSYVLSPRLTSVRKGDQAYPALTYDGFDAWLRTIPRLIPRWGQLAARYNLIDDGVDRLRATVAEEPVMSVAAHAAFLAGWTLAGRTYAGRTGNHSQRLRRRLTIAFMLATLAAGYVPLNPVVFDLIVRNYMPEKIDMGRGTTKAWAGGVDHLTPRQVQTLAALLQFWTFASGALRDAFQYGEIPVSSKMQKHYHPVYNFNDTRFAWVHLPIVASFDEFHSANATQAAMAMMSMALSDHTLNAHIRAFRYDYELNETWNRSTLNRTLNNFIRQVWINQHAPMSDITADLILSLFDWSDPSMDRYRPIIRLETHMWMLGFSDDPGFPEWKKAKPLLEHLRDQFSRNPLRLSASREAFLKRAGPVLWPKGRSEDPFEWLDW